MKVPESNLASAADRMARTLERLLDQHPVLRQQTRVVQWLLDRFFPKVQLCMGDTVRDADGLALSSRNVYLSEAERAVALQLPRALQAVKGAFEGGEREVSTLEVRLRAALQTPGPELLYAEVRQASTLASLDGLQAGQPAVAPKEATALPPAKPSPAASRKARRNAKAQEEAARAPQEAAKAAANAAAFEERKRKAEQKQKDVAQRVAEREAKAARTKADAEKAKAAVPAGK